jgi:hypothetical protein
MSAEKNESAGRRSRVTETCAAAAIALALALYWMHGMPRSPSLGWDESMNADLPALRILHAVKAGELRAAFDAALSCSQYPFVYPVVLAAVQGIFGVGESVCRATGTAVWCAALFGLFLLGRELSREEGHRSLTPWIAMALGALSPMALAFAGTLFLEIPFACASVYALRAWLRRSSRPRNGSEIAAGSWIAVCLFTKFNYGLLLAFGLALDLFCEGIAAARAGAFAPFTRRCALLALVPAAACLWWFALPIPGGLDVGLDHRRSFIAFLSLNRGFPRVEYSRRLLEASAWLTWTPRLFAVLIVGAASTLSLVARAPVRSLWLVLGALAAPTLAHPFHLDRFLLPIAVPLWALAALGLTRMLPRHPVLRPGLVGALALLTLLFPERATVRMAELLGYLNAEPRMRSYREGIVRRWSDLSASRHLPTAGLERAEMNRLLDVVAREAGPTDHIGWIGVSPELSPAAFHIGLLERGGSSERFLRDSALPMDVAYFGTDPGWSDEELSRFASSFDVIFATEPPDLKSRATRAWTRVYRERLVDRLGWNARVVGSVAIERPLQDVLEVSILACRPKR